MLITRENSRWYYRFYFPDAINITIVSEGNDRTPRRILMTLDGHSFYSQTSHRLYSYSYSEYIVYNSVFILIDHKLYPQSSCKIARKIFTSFINRGITESIRSLICAIQSVGQSILFKVNVLTNKRGNLPLPSWIASGGSSIESRELGHDSSRVDQLGARDGYIRGSSSNLF